MFSFIFTHCASPGFWRENTFVTIVL
jgi:hypothetical protein